MKHYAYIAQHHLCTAPCVDTRVLAESASETILESTIDRLAEFYPDQNSMLPANPTVGDTLITIHRVEIPLPYHSFMRWLKLGRYDGQRYDAKQVGAMVVTESKPANTEIGTIVASFKPSKGFEDLETGIEVTIAYFTRIQGKRIWVPIHYRETQDAPKCDLTWLNPPSITTEWLLSTMPEYRWNWNLSELSTEDNTKPEFIVFSKTNMCRAFSYLGQVDSEGRHRAVTLLREQLQPYIAEGEKFWLIDEGQSYYIFGKRKTG